MISTKDIREIIQVAFCYILTSVVHKPHGFERIQLDGDLFLRKIQSNSNPKAIILAIRGGVCHMGAISFYINLMCHILPDYQVYFFEKLRPMVNFEFSHDVDICLRYLRNNHPDKKIILAGFSMGGILTWTYLSRGYDRADLYIPISAPINLEEFRSNIHKHISYHILHKRVMRDFRVQNDQELLELAGYTQEMQDRNIQEFLPRLITTQNIWQNKTIAVTGTHDTLLESYPLDLEKFPILPYSLLVDKGTHCCYDVINYTCLVIKLFTERTTSVEQILKIICDR